jgi:hypothetical protein
MLINLPLQSYFCVIENKLQCYNKAALQINYLKKLYSRHCRLKIIHCQKKMIADRKAANIELRRGGVAKAKANSCC